MVIMTVFGLYRGKLNPQTKISCLHNYVIKWVWSLYIEYVCSHSVSVTQINLHWLNSTMKHATQVEDNPK